MKIRYNGRYTTTIPGIGLVHPGMVVDLPHAQAKGLLASGLWQREKTTKKKTGDDG